MEGCVEIFSLARTKHNLIKVVVSGCLISKDKKSIEFLSTEQTLVSSSGYFEERSAKAFDFLFTADQFVKEYNSYISKFMSISYSVIVKDGSKVLATEPLLIQNCNSQLNVKKQKLTIEIGMEDCLQLQIRINSNIFKKKGCILGDIMFNLVKLRVKNVELQIFKVEVFEKATERTLLYKFEIFSGQVESGTKIPFRLYLEGITSSINKIKVTESQFSESMTFREDFASVNYNITFVVHDKNNRRYFKDQLIYIT